MRKRYWILVVLAFLISGCGGFSFTKPEKTIALTLVAKNSGFLLAQERPELAQEILEASQGTLSIDIEDFTIEALFHVWVDMVMEKLNLHPFLQMNFEELIKLVNIEIELSEGEKETMELLYQVIRNFVIGIEAGSG